MRGWISIVDEEAAGIEQRRSSGERCRYGMQQSVAAVSTRPYAVRENEESARQERSVRSGLQTEKRSGQYWNPSIWSEEHEAVRRLALSNSKVFREHYTVGELRSAAARKKGRAGSHVFPAFSFGRAVQRDQCADD